MIKIDNLSKSYGDNVIFQNLNLNFNDGTMSAILGKSGCGKSTLLNIIGLLDQDFQGNIFYNNEKIDINNEKKRNEFIRNNVNYLFQNYALINDENVENNLMLALEYEKIDIKKKKEMIAKALRIVDLENYQTKKVFTLSGGEQQRISLARVMLKRGNIILADEPTGNLDLENSSRVLNILKLLKNQGKTIIVVTHDDKITSEFDQIIKL